ncbi:putative CTD small phosphatase-like protein 2 [Quillaja saponaria]|uniref:CTD small phosphatase-like protein 2 n=1 Tax=Quillaja saponaria TaxID=32244 RepID=A0AAD7QHQ0_QUISA|nr:putative CTD small phosphatase-like protein 2 [Quillaja saponaria]
MLLQLGLLLLLDLAIKNLFSVFFSMSSISKAQAISSNYITISEYSDESPEESTWTMYLEDFSFNNSNNYGDYCSISSTSSLLSDAASLAAHTTKFDNYNKRLSFKKRKSNTKEALVDDDLEDTASSPVNSPKEKGSGSGQIAERNELDFKGREKDCIELKERGLCLVPLSMIVNYLG